jgi:hypothetical protein
MRFLVVSALAFALFPGTALAAAPELVVRDVPLGGGRLLASSVPRSFDLVGLHWRGPGKVLFRARSARGRWSAWRPAAPDAEDLPDRSHPEGRAAAGWRLGNPWWVGPSTAIQYRLRGQVTRLRAHFVRSAADGVPLRATSLAGSPPVLPRAGWGAVESIRRGAPEYAPAVRFAVVHHTAGANAYTRAQSAAIVRAIQTYHVRGNGWNDIGYNFLVDKYGQVFEGRYGGVDKAVIGAHAQGFNTGSVGVAVLGNYDAASLPRVARDAVASLLAWRLDVAHVDPLSSLTWRSSGNPRFSPGAPVFLRAVVGHRDTGFTSCPGGAIYGQLGLLARLTSTTGQPKLYAPAVQGGLGGPIRFTGRLSQPLPWTVTIRDEAGVAVAVGSGTSTAVDWTWDATLAAPARYSYAIEAPSVRRATGRIGTRATTLAMTDAAARPRTFTPNGDSVADSTVVSYTLSLPAVVTAQLLDADGVPLATLFSGQRQAGRHSFRFSAQGVPDGSYTIALVARAANGREARTQVAIVVDRTLAALAVTPAAFSPNGDGRADRAELSFVLAAPATVEVRLERRGTEPATLFAGPLEPGEHRYSIPSALPDGRYRVVVNADGLLGRRSLFGQLAADTRPPSVQVLSSRRLRVSEPATLVLNVGGRRIVQVVRGGVVRIAHPLPVRRFNGVAWDAAGNHSRRFRYP